MIFVPGDANWYVAPPRVVQVGRARVRLLVYQMLIGIPKPLYMREHPLSYVRNQPNLHPNPHPPTPSARPRRWAANQ